MMNTSGIHDSGALILDTSDALLMDRIIRPGSRSASQQQQQPAHTILKGHSLGEDLARSSPSAKGRDEDLAGGSNFQDHHNDDYDDDGDMGAWPADNVNSLDVPSPSFGRLGGGNEVRCVFFSSRLIILTPPLFRRLIVCWFSVLMRASVTTSIPGPWLTPTARAPFQRSRSRRAEHSGFPRSCRRRSSPSVTPRLPERFSPL